MKVFIYNTKVNTFLVVFANENSRSIFTMQLRNIYYLGIVCFLKTITNKALM